MANIVTAKDLSKYLKLSESTIYKLALSGELPGFKIGDSWRFDMEEILARIKAKKSLMKGDSKMDSDKRVSLRKKSNGRGEKEWPN
jgi:excisionase family DNA binding protein